MDKKGRDDNTAVYQPRWCIRSISHKFKTPEKRPYNGRNGCVHEYVTVVTQGRRLKNSIEKNDLRMVHG
eukprot:COSAG01_NODE_2814_length_7026_cov_16.232857_4_plen_69_part_00